MTKSLAERHAALAIEAARADLPVIKAALAALAAPALAEAAAGLAAQRDDLIASDQGRQAINIVVVNIDHARMALQLEATRLAALIASAEQ